MAKKHKNPAFNQPIPPREVNIMFLSYLMQAFMKDGGLRITIERIDQHEQPSINPGAREEHHDHSPDLETGAIPDRG